MGEGVAIAHSSSTPRYLSTTHVHAKSHVTGASATGSSAADHGQQSTPSTALATGRAGMATLPTAELILITHSDWRA